MTKPDPPAGEPVTSGRLKPNPDVVERLATGSVDLSSFSIAFPMEHLQTRMEWEDVVLHPKTWHQIREIEHWVKDNSLPRGDRGVAERVKAGYRVLFHGPAGTGKTLTASLLGKTTGRPVFRIPVCQPLVRHLGDPGSVFFDGARD